MSSPQQTFHFFFKSFLTPYSLLKQSQWILPLNHLVPVLTPLPSSTQYFIALHHTLFSLSPTSILSWRDGVLFVFLSPNASCRCSFSVPPKKIRKDSPLYLLKPLPSGPRKVEIHKVERDKHLSSLFQVIKGSGDGFYGTTHNTQHFYLAFIVLGVKQNGEM